MSRIIAISSLVLGAVLCACGPDAKPEPETAKVEPAPEPKATAKPKADDKPAKQSDDDSGPVNIDDRLARMCSLPNTPFDFNSTQLSHDARSVLDKLAECFKTGPAKDKAMNIVGHADPRGETEYNFGLGQRRAASVASYIIKAGVAETRVASSSRGELEASGTDEAGWARDRRVEIFLAE